MVQLPVCSVPGQCAYNDGTRRQVFPHSGQGVPDLALPAMPLHRSWEPFAHDHRGPRSIRVRHKMHHQTAASHASAVADCGTHPRPRMQAVVAGQHRHTVRRARPLLRRFARTERPARVRMRRRKPCFLCRRRLLGWYVRFMLKSFRGSLASAWNWPPSTTGGCTAGSRQGPDLTSILHDATAAGPRSPLYTLRHEPASTTRRGGPELVGQVVDNRLSGARDAISVNATTSSLRNRRGGVTTDFPQVLSTCGELVSI